MPANVFLSHAREDETEVEYLQRLLRARGIRAWRDLTDLPLGAETKGHIEAAIAEECDAFLLYLTQACLASAFVWEIEVPAALRRHQADPDFGIIPVFRAVSTKEVEGFCANRGYRPITDFNGVVFPQVRNDNESVAIQAFLAQVASRTLRSALPAHFCRIGAVSSHEPWISFHTFPFAAHSDQLDLDVDWSPFLCNRAATSEEWDTILLPSLGEIKDTLSGLPLSRRLHLIVQARLPALVAIGYMFRASTGFSLAIESRGAIYSTTEAITEQSPLEVACETRSGGSGITIVEMSISRDVSTPVTDYVTGHDLTFTTYLRFRPPGGPSREAVQDTEHALAMARQVGREIQRLNDRRQADEMHIFIAAPAPVAVLLGHQLNACGRIHLYQRMEGVYTPACVLS